MSASLVGSEMCIRDRSNVGRHACPGPRQAGWGIVCPVREAWLGGGPYTMADTRPGMPTPVPGRVGTHP
eukprot:10758108-Alexandrium_andersonii.AAC.1